MSYQYYQQDDDSCCDNYYIESAASQEDDSDDLASSGYLLGDGQSSTGESFDDGSPYVTDVEDLLAPSAAAEHSQQDTDASLERPTVDESGPLVDYNEEFQLLWTEMSAARTDNNVEQMYRCSQQLNELNSKFVRQAAEYATLLIHERRLEAHMRREKPLAGARGVAGGSKYLHRNIFYKFSVDDHSLYGCDRVAGKVAGREIRGLNAIVGECLAHSVDLIRFPLMVCIKLHGYVLLASSTLPIGDSSLVYGSDDGGQTVHCDASVAPTMSILGQSLNLKQHAVRQSTLCFPADIEVHKGSDHRYYCLDTARVFPPMPPNKLIQASHLYRLFRPEFVRRNSVPMCSDGFSGFGKIDRRAHNAELRRAYNRLVDYQIPKFVRKFEENINSETLAELLHAGGINCNMLWHVYKCLQRIGAKRTVLVEMLARALKNHQRETQESPEQILELLTIDGRNYSFLQGMVYMMFEVEEEHFSGAFGGVDSHLVYQRFLRVARFHPETFKQSPKIIALNTLGVWHAYCLTEFSGTTVGRDVMELTSRAVSVYRECLSQSQGNAKTYNNYAVACLEAARHRMSSNPDEALAHARAADEAFDIAHWLEPKSAARLMNWAAALRFLADLSNDRTQWLRVERRVRRAVALSQRPTSDIDPRTQLGNAGYLLAITGLKTGSLPLMQEGLVMLDANGTNYDRAVVRRWIHDAGGPDDTKQAIILLNEVVSNESSASGVVDASYELGQLAMSTGDFETACTHFTKCGPTFWKGLQQHSVALLHLAKQQASYELAVQAYEKAGESLLVVESPHGYQARSDALMCLRKNFGLAEEKLAYVQIDLLHQCPKTAENLIYLGHAYVDLPLDIQAGYTCDQCGCSRTEFRGNRYHCLQCTDYDMCSACYNGGGHEHKVSTHAPYGYLTHAHKFYGNAFAMLQISLEEAFISGNEGLELQSADCLQRVCAEPSLAAQYRHLLDHKQPFERAAASDPEGPRFHIYARLQKMLQKGE